jgi:hypothetical protein
MVIIFREREQECGIARVFTFVSIIGSHSNISKYKTYERDVSWWMFEIWYKEWGDNDKYHHYSIYVNIITTIDNIIIWIILCSGFMSF